MKANKSLNIERLFDIEQLETNINYFSRSKKIKWTKKFQNYCNELYDKESENTGIFCCGFMNICKKCDCKKMNGCNDCVETIKKILLKIGIEIDYNNYDFEHYINIAENFLEGGN